MEQPSVVAVIPARGGSKGVPRKNVRPIGGVPLVTRAVRSLLAAGVPLVVVSTDDDEIAQVATAAGARVVRRPGELAGDQASSESALLHVLGALAAEGVEPEVTVFVQATSPFIEPDDVAGAVASVLEGRADVAFSVTPTDLHVWREGPDGPEGVNHDKRVRLRRQDREPEFAETGAFYAMRTSGFLEHEHRFFGTVHMVAVDPETAVEIDTFDDFALAELIHERRARRGAEPAAADDVIPALAVVTDFDGVHTEDTAIVDQDGRESVTVRRGDGMGVSLLRKAGVPLLILSTETNPVVIARARKLQVDVISGCDDKLTALREWADQQGVHLADVVYLGNDVNDVACLEAVGWPAVVADAHPTAKAAARLVLRSEGGRGAVRELADRVLAARDGVDAPTR